MSSNQFSIIVSIAGQAPARHDLRGEVVTLGRGPDSDIQVLVSEVSVKHAEFRVSAEGTKIADVGSTNGTAVNGTRIASVPISLSPNDKLTLGNTIPVYFVPTAVLDSTPINEVINSIDSAVPETAPVAAIAAAAPAPVRPVASSPVAPAAPAGGAAPPSQGPSTIRLDKVRPNDMPVRPGAPAPQPGAPAPARPVTPLSIPLPARKAPPGS